MNTISSNNRRIAQNTLMLYIRMFMIMAVSLVTFRLLLQSLGEIDYGIYNVVGGVVVLFAFLNSAMSQSSQRYFSYYIGIRDKVMLCKMFSASVVLHMAISLVAFILAETVGLWFLNTYMNFPAGSIRVVNIVYQSCIVVFVIQILIVPYHAVIISHEKMVVYAYISIVEVILKFSAVAILFVFDTDRLIIYSFASVIVSLSIALFYRGYCKHKFEICQSRLPIERKTIKELTGFSGWNMLGGIGNIGASQGVNIIINIFYGVILNAALGVANQVSGAVNSFVGNFQTAFNPQIIKDYASGEKEAFNNLVFRASRFSFGLIFILGFPVIIFARPILEIWLTVVPEYSVEFTQLIIMFSMIDAISGPLWTAAQASGKIKMYMIIISLMIFSNVPAAYIILYLGLSPVYVIVYKVVMNFLIHITRIIYLTRIISFPGIGYFREVMIPVFILILASIPLPFLLNHFGDSNEIGLQILKFVSIFIFGIVLSYYILFNRQERIFVIQSMNKVIQKIIQK